MANGRMVQVVVGEYGLYGTAAHISVAFIDDKGNRLFEVNGIPQPPNINKEKVVALGILGAKLGIVKYDPDEDWYLYKPETKTSAVIAEIPWSEWPEYEKQINESGITYRALLTNSNAVAATLLKLLDLGPELEKYLDKQGRILPGVNIDLLERDKDFDGVPDWRDADYTNFLNWFGDHDGDGTPNIFDRTDGVGFRDKNKPGESEGSGQPGKPAGDGGRWGGDPHGPPSFVNPVRPARSRRCQVGRQRRPWDGRERSRQSPVARQSQQWRERAGQSQQP